MRSDVHVRLDHESGQTILIADTEAALTRWIARLQAVAEVAVTYGAPAVSYRERARSRGHAGHRPHAANPSITLTVVAEPHVDASPDEAGDGPFAAAIRDGLLAARASGPIAGFPVVDTRFSVRDLRVSAGLSPVEIVAAVRDASHRALIASGCELVEPVVRYTVSVPVGRWQAASFELDRRDVPKTHCEQNWKTAVAAGKTPLSRLLGFEAIFPETDGVIALHVDFSHYAALPSTTAGSPLPPAGAAAAGPPAAVA